MGAVWHPIDPFEFSQIWFSAVDVNSASEVGIFWRVFRQEEFGSWDLEEGFLDGVQLDLSESFVALKLVELDWRIIHKHNRSTAIDICPSTIWS